MAIALTILAIIIVAALALYAWRLTRQVKAAEERQQKEQIAAAEALRSKQLELVSDIHFVARAMLAQQCEVSEGVLRLHHLIQSLDPEVWPMQELSAVRRHYQAIADMPILEAYKQLNKREQFKLDKQRWQLESDNQAAIETELQWLVNYGFPNVTLLH